MKISHLCNRSCSVKKNLPVFIVGFLLIFLPFSYAQNDTWHRVFNSPTDFYVQDLTEKNNEEITITGLTEGSVISQFRASTLTVNSQGDILEAHKMLSEDENIYAFSSASDASGFNYTLIGKRQENSGSNIHHTFLLKTDAEGNVLRSGKTGRQQGDLSEYGGKILVTENDNIFTVGVDAGKPVLTEFEQETGNVLQRK